MVVRKTHEDQRERKEAQIPQAPKRRKYLTFDELPLFADDRLIAEACVGSDHERVIEWMGKLPELELCGFPKPIKLYGLRYTPAVREFYDREFMPPPAWDNDRRR